MDSKAIVDFAMTLIQAGFATFMFWGAWLCLTQAFAGRGDFSESSAPGALHLQ